jgi:hypothetical protein
MRLTAAPIVGMPVESILRSPRFSPSAVFRRHARGRIPLYGSQSEPYTRPRAPHSRAARPSLALLVVAASTVSALVYAALHHSETLAHLATSTLSGIGMAVGGCLGSALILRFKAARKFRKNVVREVNNRT